VLRWKWFDDENDHDNLFRILPNISFQDLAGYSTYVERWYSYQTLVEVNFIVILNNIILLSQKYKHVGHEPGFSVFHLPTASLSPLPPLLLEILGYVLKLSTFQREYCTLNFCWTLFTRVQAIQIPEPSQHSGQSCAQAIVHSLQS